MNLNCCPDFILEDTFNSDHNQEVLAVALSAPMFTCPLDESVVLIGPCRCTLYACCVAAFFDALYHVYTSLCKESFIVVRMILVTSML